MRLTYAVGLEDFRALQPPFVLRAGKNAGFKGVLVACGLIALLGAFCLVEGFGVLVAAFLIGLGVVAAGLAYLYDKRSVSKTQEAYEKRVLTALDMCIVLTSAYLRPTTVPSRRPANVEL